jgi:hypothetical protein
LGKFAAIEYYRRCGRVVGGKEVKMRQPNITELSEEAIKLTRLAVQIVFAPWATIKEPQIKNSVSERSEIIELTFNPVVSIDNEEGQIQVVCTFMYKQKSIGFWKATKLTLSNGDTTIVFNVVSTASGNRLMTWAQMEQNLSIARRLELYSKHDFEYSKKPMYTHR